MTPLDLDNEKKLNNFLNKQLKNFDLVIISDYGHGFISDKMLLTFKNLNMLL